MQFSVLDVENLRLHYAKTLEHWRRRFEGASDQVQTMFDEHVRASVAAVSGRLRSGLHDRVDAVVPGGVRPRREQRDSVDETAAPVRAPAEHRMERCDVLVVGGGPAGSSCARALHDAGLDVIVLDRAVFPRDKVCAGWITPQVDRRCWNWTTPTISAAARSSRSRDFAPA